LVSPHLPRSSFKQLKAYQFTHRYNTQSAALEAMINRASMEPRPPGKLALDGADLDRVLVEEGVKTSFRISAAAVDKVDQYRWRHEIDTRLLTFVQMIAAAAPRSGA